MTPTARDNVIQHFMNNPDVTVFLISLKAGGVALNLIEASRVIILDPWYVSLIQEYPNRDDEDSNLRMNPGSLSSFTFPSFDPVTSLLIDS